MENSSIAATYKGSFSEFKPSELYNIGEFLTKRSDFSEEQPLILTAFEGNISPLEDLICCGVAGGGGHAVRLSKLNFNVFVFALKFLGADYGIYLKGEKDTFFCGVFDGKGKEIENFSKDFKDYSPSNAYKGGKVSGYTGIIEKYLMKDK